MKIDPIGDALVVKQDEIQETKSGIAVAGVGKPSRGVVLFTGPGRLMEDGTRYPMQVKVGDTILFHKFSVVEIMFGEKPVLLMHELQDVFGIIKK